jgi:hypothetical protein
LPGPLCASWCISEDSFVDSFAVAMSAPQMR